MIALGRILHAYTIHVRTYICIEFALGGLRLIMPSGMWFGSR